jgi:hypothetical protein
VSDDLFSDVLPADPRDDSLESVVETFTQADPTGERAARVFRATFDQLYDGQHTGRYSWDQLYKTEKTHYGTLIEINLRRAFADVIADGVLLDYRIAGHEIDCKYSYRDGGWMLPPECFGELLLVSTANDQASTWSLGVVRAKPEYLRPGTNRDSKSGLNPAGRSAIRWLQWHAALAPNILLQLDPAIVRAVFEKRSGQARLDELFRRVNGRRIGDNTIAAVAQQKDYPKRVRTNGGSRTNLAPEGFIILCGDYSTQCETARLLGTAVPGEGEYVSVRVVPANGDEEMTAEIEGRLWRVARPDEPSSVPAPTLTNQ